MTTDKSTMQAAHSLLELLITKATISGKLTNSSIKIPYSELTASVGQQRFKDVNLVIQFNLNWEASND